MHRSKIRAFIDSVWNSKMGGYSVDILVMNLWTSASHVATKDLTVWNLLTVAKDRDSCR